MPVTIASTLLDAIKRGRAFPVLELTIGTDTHKFANGPIASASSGMYLPRIPEGGWGEFGRAADSASMALQNSQTSVTVEDITRVLQKSFGGPNSGNVVGSAAKKVLRAKDVPAADHYTLFDGIIERYRPVGDLLWSFQLKPNDRSLSSPNRLPTVSAFDFPNAPEASVGKNTFAVYGSHISQGVTDATGMIELLNLDTVNNWWGGIYGRILTLHNVWRNGTLATGDFVREFKIVNGKHYTIIRDSADISVATDTITVDVDGYESDGDGSSGPLIRDPEEQLSHFLANFVFNDYPDDSPDSLSWINVSQAPIETSLFDETGTFLSTVRGHEGSKRIEAGEEALKTVNTWCEEHQISPFWTRDGNLAIRPDDPAQEIYIDSRHIRSEDVIGGTELTGDDVKVDRIITRITMNYLLNDAKSDLTKQTRIANEGISPTVLDTMNFTWGKSFV